MKSIANYLAQLIKANSGVSSKAFFLVAVTIIGCTLLIVVGFTLVWEVVTQGTITTDLTGLSAFVAAIASLFATAGVTKAWSEASEAKASSSNTTTDGTTA